MVKNNSLEMEQSNKNSATTLFDLPYPVLSRITTWLNLRDAMSFACCCKEAHSIVMDQHTWRQRLWYWGKTVNVCMAKNCSPKLMEASAVISDPLLLNMRTLYYVLSPCACSQRSTGASRVDVANLLAKLDPALSSNPNLFNAVMNMLAKLLGHKVALHDQSPFEIGAGASRYLLFSQPETDTARELLMALVASRSHLLETVGLVEGKPGGVGSGVTVRYEPVQETVMKGNKGIEGQLFNLLPLRRVFPRLLVPCSTEGGPLRFVDEVAQVVRNVDGIVCVLDAECRCHLNSNDAWNSNKCSSSRSSNKTNSSNNSNVPTTVIDGHHLELLELEAMLRTIPSSKCPVFLLLMAHTKPRPEANDDDDDASSGAADGASAASAGASAASAGAAAADQPSSEPSMKLHKPYLLRQLLDPLHIPWAAFEVEVESLSGLSLALNWLVKRTTAQQASSNNAPAEL